MPGESLKCLELGKELDNEKPTKMTAFSKQPGSFPTNPNPTLYFLHHCYIYSAPDFLKFVCLFYSPNLSFKLDRFNFPGFKPQNHRIHVKVLFYIIRLLNTKKHSINLSLIFAAVLFSIPPPPPLCFSPSYQSPSPRPPHTINRRHRTRALAIPPASAFTSPHPQHCAQLRFSQVF